MNRKVFFLLLSVLLCCSFVRAQEVQKSEFQQKAEAVDPKQDIAKARSLYIHAFNDYVNTGQTKQAVECGVKAAALYHKENFFKESFELLRRVDQAIVTGKDKTPSVQAGLHYLVTKERLAMYMKFRKIESAKEQLSVLENQATTSGDENLKNDLLYNKATFYYTFGQIAQGNAVFKEMANKLTASKEYDKVDEVYQTLISNARKSNNASMVAQSYSNYLAWKDSTNALKHADEIKALKKEIADNEATISEKDSSLTIRWAVIIGLIILAAALAAALVIGGVILLRFILLTRKQKKTINLANESNALKAKFISNISAQLEPTLKKLDPSIPEVKALLDFSDHIETLSQLENRTDTLEVEEVQVQAFSEELVDLIRDKVKGGVNIVVNVPKMSANFNKEYVSHILSHLLKNAAEYTPDNGKITLEFKKRSAHSYQFLVADTGEGIPEEKREDIFKPFREIRDLTTGDGLGLPTCKQMALKMKGDLEVDPEYTKGTRFLLDLQA